MGTVQIPDSKHKQMMEAMPIPFITTGEDGTSLSVNPKAKEILTQIKKPLVVISVVGLYRTGKSFLLNCLMNKTNGFPLGSTVEAKTKGIWMWVGDFPNDARKAMVLLDTEGLHDPEKGSKSHDTELFTLAVLLSSVMIYNSKGAIDANSLEVLQVATELTSNISMKADKGKNEEEFGDEFSKFFPMLIWAIRDHHLEMKHDGIDITANEYLESCLALKRGRTKDIISSNGLKETIRAFFKRRHCFIFPLPTDMENLKNLDHLEMTDLKPNFADAGKRFTKFIFENGLEKMVHGKEVTGSMFTTLTEKYVEAVTDVNVESTYDYMIQKENSRSIEQAVLHYETHMSSLQLPVASDSLNKMSKKAQSEAADIFLKTAVNHDKNIQYFNKFNEQLEGMHQQNMKRNQAASQEKCDTILSNLFKKIETQIDEGHFTCPGGHASFKALIDEMEKAYSSIPEDEKGPCGQLSLLKFKSQKIEPRRVTFLQSDKALSQEQKKQEELRCEIEEKKNDELLLKAQKETLQKERDDMKKSFENKIEKQAEELQRQYEKNMINLKANLQLAQEEKERLIKEGFEEKANLMKEELEEAKEDISKKEKDKREMEEKIKKEMKDKVNQMEVEHEERKKVIQQLEARIKKGTQGILSQFFRKAVDVFIDDAEEKKSDVAELFELVGRFYDYVTDRTPAVRPVVYAHNCKGPTL